MLEVESLVLPKEGKQFERRGSEKHIETHGGKGKFVITYKFIRVKGTTTKVVVTDEKNTIPE